ncbi:MAG: PKD domain-containing protein [Flavobacteriales bacterium]|nr:PKD domain-containing protein [Flavobacteriales bacterium]
MSALSYATFFGGSISHEHVDGGTSRFDRRGRVYQSVCAGCGSNSDFPIEPNPGAVSATNNSPNCNNAVFKFDFDAPLVVAAADAPDTVCADAPVQFSNYSNGASYLWEFGDGDSSTLTAPQHTYQTTGNFIVTLTAFDPASCNGEDQISFTVTVLDAAPALEAMNDTLYCGPLASFTLTASGTGDVNTWHWSSNADFSDMLNSSPSDSTALIQPAVSGTWYVQGSTSGCARIDSVAI